MIGADSAGAWLYSSAAGAVATVDGSGVGSGSRLVALDNAGVAVGMSTLSSVYQPITYRYGGVRTATLTPGLAVVDVNDAGTVLTGYNDTSGNFFTFLLRPLP